METNTPPSSSGGSCIAQGLAALVGIVFVFITVLTLIALPAEAQLFNPKVYKQALTSQGLYERLPSLLATIPLSSSSDDPENDARYLKSDDMEVIFSELLPKETTQSLMEEIIDQTLTYYNSTDPQAKIQVSMVDLKTRLGGESGDRVMRQIVSSWPSCTETQNQTWREALDSDTVEMPKCSPSQDILDDATPKLGKAFDDMVADIPDVADMTPKYVLEPGATGADPRPTLMVVRWIIRLSPLLSVFLLALVTVLAVRSRRSFFGWWGALFLIVGVVTFLLAAISGLMVEGMIGAMASEMSSQAQEGGELVLAFMRVISYVLRGVGIRISIMAVLSGLMGLTMIVVAFILGRRKSPISDPYTTLPR